MVLTVSAAGAGQEHEAGFCGLVVYVLARKEAAHLSGVWARSGAAGGRGLGGSAHLCGLRGERGEHGKQAKSETDSGQR